MKDYEDLSFEDLDVELDGAALLNEMRDVLERYVIFPSEYWAIATTLWIAATHAQPAWEYAPRLVAKSPVKRCGKSRLIDVAQALSYNPILTVNASSAVIVRSIDEDDPPTLFIDEADTIFSSRGRCDSKNELRGILNAGYQRNRSYRRCNPKTFQPESFNTYCMAMIGCIGSLPDTIEDRAIVIPMRRRMSEESIDPFNTMQDESDLNDLRDRLHLWIRPNLDVLAKANPEMPVDDRDADTWTPLVAIADLAGGEWPQLARDACLKIVSAAPVPSVEPLNQTLLKDIRVIFNECDESFIGSNSLVERLRGIGEAPWEDEQLTPYKLANMLGDFGIKSRRNPTGSYRGYASSDFQDAFNRYLKGEEDALC